jgi:hypothetical protein
MQELNKILNLKSIVLYGSEACHFKKKNTFLLVETDIWSQSARI